MNDKDWEAILKIIVCFQSAINKARQGYYSNSEIEMAKDIARERRDALRKDDHD